MLRQLFVGQPSPSHLEKEGKLKFWTFFFAIVFLYNDDLVKFRELPIPIPSKVFPLLGKYLLPRQSYRN